MLFMKFDKGILFIVFSLLQDVVKSELKAERLLTSLLREKLYSKELEIEQLQAEIATAARTNHILRCEVQNAQDNISCITHKLKDQELQVISPYFMLTDSKLDFWFL